MPVDAARCYELYSQLEEHPRWSPWLRSVVFLDQVRTRHSSLCHHQQRLGMEGKGITNRAHLARARERD